MSLSRRAVIAGGSAAGFTALVASAAGAQSSDDIEANKVLVRRLFDEVYTAGNLDAADDLIAAGFTSDVEGDLPGIDAFKQRQADLRRQYEQFFRSYRWDITDIAAEGAIVFVRSTFTGQQIAEGAADISVLAFVEAQIQGGKIAKTWSLVDVNGLTAQLGQ